MRKVKIGFLGVGYMGQLAHLLNYVQLPDYCEIVALCDVRIEQARHLATRYHIPKVYADYKELLADKEIEAVVCVQSFENHVVLVPEVLRAGKHVLTEKPLCVFPHNGAMLAQIAKETGKLHMVGYHKRSDPATEHAMSIINQWKESGEFGKMTYVRLSMPPGNYRKDADEPYFTNEPPAHVPPEPGPEGITEDERNRMIWFVNYYIHQVNLMRHLLGEDYSMAYADKHLFTAKSESGVNCVLELEPFNTTIDWQEHALVCFERGWVRIDLAAPLATQLASTVTIYRDKGMESAFSYPMITNVCAMRNQAKNFLLAVTGERTAPCISEEAVRDLEIAEDYIKRTDPSDVKKPYHLRNIDK
ncbi:MAG: Gfo/Idh/MocA family oxidoreductase [Defluviitaleaceae bacterium]|nr:Gfo/Idh/MocA family oxidoreductase [Defluviitaleaceae bacterium]